MREDRRCVSVGMSSGKEIRMSRIIEGTIMEGVATNFFEVRFLSGFSNRGNMTGCLFSEFSGTGTVFCFRSCGTITVVFG